MSRKQFVFRYLYAFELGLAQLNFPSPWPVWRIRDVYPGSWFFTHPGSQNSNKREGWKNFFVIPFYLATNFTKLTIILVLKSWRKKFGSIFKELYNFLPKKLSLSSQTYGFGIRDPEKTYSGSRIQGSKRHRIPDPQHWPWHCKYVLYGTVLYIS
jgi:hypothetical protein